MTHLETVRQHYSNATSTVDAVDKVLDIIESKYNIKPHQIMSADSICCDDVNVIQYPMRALEMLGPFKLGGLDGYPFAGLTGMGAFAHHVPEDGAIFIFYAPHIGVTKDGKIGEINRYGQSTNSSCCGAAQAGLGKLKNSKIEKGQITTNDFQMNTIEQILLDDQDRILKAEVPIMEATEVIYEAIDKQIEFLVSQTEYPCRYVFLAGGIYINGDKDMGSFSSFKKFDCIDRQENTRTSLLNEYLS